MRKADRYRSRVALIEAVRRAAPPRAVQNWPRLSIWHGGDDRVVDPENAEILASQWSGIHGFEEAATSDIIPIPGIRHKQWGSSSSPIVELWIVEAMGHGFPVDPSLKDGTRAGVHVLATQISAARHIAKFWRIGK